ncbi:hypothetical protein K1T35_43805 [Pseudonocardia sp. DSM 110487]|uniref:hypothetical protein n=1 Tax=Pseudonocardia sp. DSM 110487 TaxID=2865833 RepID=UPI001C69D633|nr:hypothetical protein [Pseudonocardia sp. DSM 110487]QYN35186.1 hypothetical protein K1T35_43805 [Pseudonocardia sp. DSM 110487]
MTTQQVAVGLLVLAGLAMASIWTSGARAGRNSERAVREVTRMTGTAGRTLAAAAVIVGTQWAVVALTSNAIAIGVALGLPALFAGTTIARLLAVTTVVRTLPRGGARR